MDDCIFCKIVSGQIPCKIITETPNCLSFMDAYPLAKGHSLVIPKNHYAKIQDIPEKENAELFETVRKVIAKVDKITDGTLLAVHNGVKSGQEIPHVHVHLVPRDKSIDGAGPIHDMFNKDVNITKEEADQLYEQLKD
jgi:histidine triad (HIT) family protein